MTGLEFSNVYDLKVDKAYSGFLSPVKKNRLFKEALVLAIETKYKDLQSQKTYDEISNLIKTNQVKVPVSNQVSVITSTSLIPDYQHLLAIKARFVSPIEDVSITGATNASPVVITVNNFNSIRTGDQVVISGVVGNFNANGTFYLNRINRKKFELYYDAEMLLPVSGSGVYLQGGNIDSITYNYCKPLYSDTKISVLGQASVDAPKFEITQNLIKIYPIDKTCSQVTIDYINQPPVFITSTDNVIDLELTYPVKFLYYIADVAAQLFSESVKDQELFQTSNFELNTNK
jgi:hypothetical protein